MNGGADLVLAHLYPDLLRTYGDRGNVLALTRRAEWRGFHVRVAEVTRGGQVVRSARFMASRVVAVVEHPAAEAERQR